MLNDGNEFVLLFNEHAWREVEEKLEHLTGKWSGGFNWLTNEGDVDVLITYDGAW